MQVLFPDWALGQSLSPFPPSKQSKGEHCPDTRHPNPVDGEVAVPILQMRQRRKWHETRRYPTNRTPSSRIWIIFNPESIGEEELLVFMFHLEM